MAKITQANVPDVLKRPAPVTGDAAAAGAPYSARATAMQEINRIAENFDTKRRAARDADYITKTSADLALELDNAFLEMQKKRQNNPEGLARDFTNYMDKTFERALENAPSEAAKRTLDGRIAQYATKYGVAANTFENNRTIELYQNNLDQSYNNTIELARRSGGNIMQLNELYNSQIAAIDAATVSEDNPNGFLPIENAQARKMKIKQGVYGSGIESLIATDPAAAVQSIEAGQWNEYADPISLSKSLNAAQSQLNRKAAENRYQNSLRIESMQRKVRRTGNIASVQTDIAELNLNEVEGAKLVDDLTLQAERGRHEQLVMTMTPQEYERYIGDLNRQLTQLDKNSSFEEANNISMQLRAATEALEFRQNALKQPVDSILQNEVRSMEGEAPKQAAMRALSSNYDYLISQQKDLLQFNNNQIEVLPRAEANEIATRLQQAQPTEKLQIIDSLKIKAAEKAGGDGGKADSYFRYMLNSLAKLDVEKEVLMAAQLHPVAEQGKREILAGLMDMKMKHGDKYMTELENGFKAVSVNDTDARKAITEELRSELNELVLSHVDDPANALNVSEEANAILRVTEPVALIAYNKHKDVDKAVQIAAGIVKDQYNIIEDGGKYVRIPRKYSQAAVEQGLKLELKDFAQKARAGKLYIPEAYMGNEEDFYEVMERDSYFTTMNDDSGVTLVVNTPTNTVGVPVEREVYTIPFSELESMGIRAQAAKGAGAAQDNLIVDMAEEEQNVEVLQSIVDSYERAAEDSLVQDSRMQFNPMFGGGLSAPLHVPKSPDNVAYQRAKNALQRIKNNPVPSPQKKKGRKKEMPDVPAELPDVPVMDLGESDL